MIGKEKILEARIATLERQVRELMKRTGMEDAEILEMEYQEALDIGAQTGDFTALKEHLKKVNGKAA